jgi:hypothetical protein
MKPLGNAINQAFCGAYQACKGKAVWIKENIRFKWRANKEIRDQYEQDMDIDPIGEGQDASEEEVEQVATKIDDIRL